MSFVRLHPSLPLFLLFIYYYYLVRTTTVANERDTTNSARIRGGRGYCGQGADWLSLLVLSLMACCGADRVLPIRWGRLLRRRDTR
jgi:hypothetical protein